MVRSIRVVGPALALLVVVPAAFAEMSPDVYRKMERQAPESLVIRVTSVKKLPERSRSRGEAVEINAKVIEVRRTASHLRPAAVICIAYEHRTTGMVGPRPVPLLVAGESYPAFLKQEAGDRYVPAAMGASFERVEGFRKR